MTGTSLLMRHILMDLLPVELARVVDAMRGVTHRRLNGNGVGRQIAILDRRPEMDTKIDLADVILCSVDCVNPVLALRAIEKSQEHCSFGRSILFTDQDIFTPNSCEIIKIDKIKSINEYSLFMLKKLHDYIDHPFALIVQWDGYVLSSSAWNDEFKKFDYIGAKWDWYADNMMMGNGGFSLRSLKLLKALSLQSYPFLENTAEDVQICRVYRNKLENEHDIKFAPTFIADQFSYERSEPNYQTFGFHGIFNMWRYLSENELIGLIRELGEHTIAGKEYVELMIKYGEIKNFSQIKHMYEMIINKRKTEELIRSLMLITNNRLFCKSFIELCEGLQRR